MIQTASLLGLLTVLLAFLGIYYLLKWSAPYILRYAVRKVEKHFKQQFEDQAFDTNDRPAKERQGNRVKKEKEVVGEYIDFEEID